MMLTLPAQPSGLSLHIPGYLKKNDAPNPTSIINAGMHGMSSLNICAFPGLLLTPIIPATTRYRRGPCGAKDLSEGLTGLISC